MLPIAVGLIDKNGHLTRANDETRRLLRLRKDEMPRFCDLLEGWGARSANGWQTSALGG